jgi:hypothetical protein
LNINKLAHCPKDTKAKKIMCPDRNLFRLRVELILDVSLLTSKFVFMLDLNKIKKYIFFGDISRITVDVITIVFRSLGNLHLIVAINSLLPTNCLLEWLLKVVNQESWLLKVVLLNEAYQVFPSGDKKLMSPPR